VPKTSAFFESYSKNSQALRPCSPTTLHSDIADLLEIGSEDSFTCSGKDGNENGNMFYEDTDNESACMETSNSIDPITTGWKKPFDPSFPNPVLKSRGHPCPLFLPSRCTKEEIVACAPPLRDEPPLKDQTMFWTTLVLMWL
jgi:hypothetical protein